MTCKIDDGGSLSSYNVTIIDDVSIYNINLSWINTLKALCMFLVFINHSEVYTGINSEVFDNIYRPVFVNAFFFLNGYLLFRKQWSEGLISLVRDKWLRCIGGGYYALNNLVFRLIIPTLLFSALFYLPKKLLRGEVLTVSDFLTDTIGGGSIWFTPALAVAQLILLAFLFTRIKKPYIYLALCLGLWLISETLRGTGFQVLDSYTLPWYYKSGMEACMFMVLGGYYWKYEDTIMRYMRKWYVVLLLLIVYLALCAFFASNIRTALDWQGLNAMGLLVALLGSIILVTFIKSLPSLNATEFIGRNSIGFYFFCGSIVNVFAVVGKRVSDTESFGFVLFVAIVSFIVAYGLVWLINRYLPFVYDLRKLYSNKKR